MFCSYNQRCQCKYMLFINNISIIALCVGYSVNVFDVPKLCINSMVIVWAGTSQGHRCCITCCGEVSKLCLKLQDCCIAYVEKDRDKETDLLLGMTVRARHEPCPMGYQLC